MSQPKLILYTNRGCPWAHRAHIALKESGLNYEEVIIDLNTPREPWYLEINPVSSISREYQGEGARIRGDHLHLRHTARPGP